MGIAILSTIVTRRAQFHDQRIGESVSMFDPATRQRLAESQQLFSARGSDPVTALPHMRIDPRKWDRVSAKIDGQ